MSTLNELRDSFGHALDHLAEGWHELRRKASQALTRFHPTQASAGSAPAEARLLDRTARWSFLAAEVSESDTEVAVAIEAPGMSPDSFDIQVMDDVLVIRGEKRMEQEGHHGRYYVLERAYGSFERAIPLPANVDASGARAKYRRGVLRVTVPKSAAVRQRRIEVRPG